MGLPLVVRLPVFLNSIRGRSQSSYGIIDADRNLAYAQYKEFTEEVAQRLQHEGKSIAFREASFKDIAWLDSMKLPFGVRSFFAYYEPTDVIQLERVQIVPVELLKEANIRTPMGQVVTQYGYVIIAKTKGIDVYCVDINHVDMKGQSPVYLITGNALLGDHSLESVREACYLIATSFVSFLEGL